MSCRWPASVRTASCSDRRPGCHHYVLQILLRRWTSTAAGLRTYTIRDGRLARKDMEPRYTSYENGLYALVAGARAVTDRYLRPREPSVRCAPTPANRAQ
jgi:hypothetical protein